MKIKYTPDPVELARPLSANEIDACGNLRGFNRVMWRTINPGPLSRLADGFHIACISEHVQEMFRPTSCIQNLCIEVPPRMLKSVLINVMLFGYAWLTNPMLRFIYSTNAHSLVIRDSLYCRDIITSARFRSVAGNRVVLRGDQNTQKRFTNTQQGFRLGLTVGTGIGEGGDWLVTDDAIDPRRARSPVARDALHHWWRNTFRHRVVNPATTRRLVIGARVHKHDLPGYLRENEPDEWHYLTLPMEYEPHRLTYYLPQGAKPPTDPIAFTPLQIARPELRDGPGGSGRRRLGDLLHPQRFPPNEVRSMKRGFGRDAAGQLGQRPQEEGGSVFRIDRAKQFKAEINPKTGRLVAILLDHRHKGRAGWRRVDAKRWRWFQCIDTAQTDRTTSDQTAAGTFGLSDDGDLVIWNMFAERLDIPDQFPTIQMLLRGPVTWIDGIGAQSSAPWPFDIDFRYCEAKASGYGIISEAALVATPILPMPNMPGDKVQRSTRLALMYQTGKVFHPFIASLWLDLFEDEMRLFPNGTHDDRVDAAAYAGILCSVDRLLRAHLRRRIVKNAMPTPDERADAQRDRLNRLIRDAGGPDPMANVERMPGGVSRIILTPGDPSRGIDPVYHYFDDTPDDAAAKR